jgi:hypothetical protein
VGRLDRSLPGNRRCLRCDAEVPACFGFALARDWLAAHEGRMPWSHVREHCGACVEWAIFTFGENRVSAYLATIDALPAPPRGAE